MHKPDKPDEPKKAPRSTRAEDIHRELKKSTDFARQHVDQTILEQKSLMREVLKYGDEEEFLEALVKCGINPDSDRGKELIGVFRLLRGRA